MYAPHDMAMIDNSKIERVTEMGIKKTNIGKQNFKTFCIPMFGIQAPTVVDCIYIYLRNISVRSKLRDLYNNLLNPYSSATSIRALTYYSLLYY